MHSFEAPFGTSFSYNSDLSGMVIIQELDPGISPVHVSWDDLRAFYLEQRRKKLIRALENMDYDELEKM